MLGRSSGFDETLVPLLIKGCEESDGQLHAAPPCLYAFSCLRLPQNLYVLREIFGGWHDQVGRPSRVMRCTVVDAAGWQLVAANPFLPLWLLPPLSRCISRKRNDVQTLAPVRLDTLTKSDWQKLWWKETRGFWRGLGKLKSDQVRLLLFLLQQNDPFQPQEIAVDEDCFAFCRVLTYSVPHDKRRTLQLDTFSLQDKPPDGLAFRYRPYCRSPLTLPAAGDAVVTLPTLVESMVKSLPEPHNFAILARWWLRRQRLNWVFSLLAGIAGIIIGSALYLLGKYW